MKQILPMKSSKHTKLSYFQNFISGTFLDNLSLDKKSRRQFILLFTPGKLNTSIVSWGLWNYSSEQFNFNIDSVNKPIAINSITNNRRKCTNFNISTT